MNKRKKHVIETAIEFEKYPNATYECECYDGIAYCILEDCDCDEDNGNAPKNLVVKYPEKKDVLKDKEFAGEILDYSKPFFKTWKSIMNQISH
jgi:hypothetical protein